MRRIQPHEIQGVLALTNSFNRVGLDHVLLVKVASTAVVTKLLGGNTDLDKKRAKRAIRKTFSDPMGLSVEEAAAGIVRLINARMADEIRVQAAKKVIDLTNLTLVPFGGAGPVHAAMVAEELHIPRILIPPNPGAFSALGLLCSDVVHDYIRSDINILSKLDPARAEYFFE